MLSKKSLKVNFLLTLLLASSLFPSLNNAQAVDNSKEEQHQRYDYRRLDLNNLPPLEKYTQPKVEVFPLGYIDKAETGGTNHLNKVTTGTGVWTELNPKVPRVTYIGLHFVNKDTGWACGQSGAVIKTMDGGSSWTISETPVNNLLLKTHSYNGQLVLVTGYDGIILRSIDEGETFEQVPSGVGNGYDLWGVYMINDTLGWVCGGYQTLLKTTDAGSSWQPVSTGLNQNYWAVDFINKQYGMIACSGGKVLKTIDGGNNWLQLQAGDTRALYTIDVIDSLHIAAAGADGKNVYSSDAGTTWITNPDIPVFSATNCIDFIDADTGYTAQDVYNIRKTTNRGQSWFGLPINMTSEWHIQLLDDGTGYSCGEEVGWIYALNFYKRTNGLENWSRLFLNDNFADVFYINEEYGFAISGISSEIQALYKTEDGGLTWTNVPGAPSGNNLLFLDSLTGFIGSNVIYKTTDGGLTWYVPNVGQGGAGKIFFINGTIGWAVRSNVIYKTTDRGENWFTQLIAPGAGSFSSIYFVDSLYGWASIYNRRPYKTIDGGQTWIEQINLDYYQTRDVYFKDYNTGWLIRDIGGNNLFRSFDSGQTWISVANVFDAFRFHFFPDSRHWMINGGHRYITEDNGNTWIDITNDVPTGFGSFNAVTDWLGYAVGNGGLVLKYNDTTFVPVELISFKGMVKNNEVILEWTTASELNNYGFEIQSSIENKNWQKIGFVMGRGTSTEINYYSFSELIISGGRILYRLKQIDYDGSFTYSNFITILVENLPLYFDLLQNFPNPFNNSTHITFQISSEEFVSLKLYDILGKEVKTIIDENKKAGYYSVALNANDLTSGIYFYKLTAGEYSSTKKLILLK